MNDSTRFRAGYFLALASALFYALQVVVNKYVISSTAKEKSAMIENIKKYYEDRKEEAKSDEEIEKDVTERLKEEHRQEAEWRLTKDIRDFYHARGETRVHWELSTGADKDAWDACLGRPAEVTREALAAALEKDYVNLFLEAERPCMATLRLESGTLDDVWEIIQTLVR